MNTPQFKGTNTGTYDDKQPPLYEMRQVDTRSLIGLYFSEVLLYVGFFLILLNNMNVLASGSFFGKFSWVTATVFSIGLFINFVSIPYLYFSSFRNFRKENDFWDKEVFWILPLFFFGTFFIYGSQISTAFILFVISVAAITIIHFKFVHSSWKLAAREAGQTLANHEQYSTTLKYLTAYYILLLTLLVICDPLQQAFLWIRLHV